MRAVAYIITGMIFGSGLAISGMTNPAKVTGFLDVFGEWDPTLNFVMIGAVLVYAFGGRFVQRRAAPVFEGTFPSVSKLRIDRRLLLGSVVFGVGWGLAGFCPGPAITNLGGVRVEAIGFVIAMVAGMFVAQRAFGADGVN